MNRCVQCGAEQLRPSTRTDTLTVGGRTFKAELPALECGNCGEGYIEGAAVEAFEDAVTRALVEVGASEPDALRWLRKRAKLRASELADLLGVRAETVSRWETGATEAPRAVAFTLGTLALASLYGQTSPLARIRALGEVHPPETTPIVVDLRKAG